MALCQTFKDLPVSEAFLRVCACPHISNRPCFWLWSISISIFNRSHASPPTLLPNLYSAPLYYSIFWSAAASEQAASQYVGGTAAWLRDTWQVQVQLWSVFCKESLAAENAAVSRRFTAQSLQSISFPLAGFLPQSARRRRRLPALSPLSHFPLPAYLFHSLMSWP